MAARWWLAASKSIAETNIPRRSMQPARLNRPAVGYALRSRGIDRRLLWRLASPVHFVVVHTLPGQLRILGPFPFDRGVVRGADGG